ncbi:MAG: BON domain-containing protein [Bryobacterales bacterium]
MRRFTFLTLLASLLVGPSMLPAQDRTTEQIRKQIAKLSDYGVFDNIEFTYSGGTATLMGEASRPQLKSQAEKAVSRIEGVQNVPEQIEVLPNSNVDDSIRTAAYIPDPAIPISLRYNPNRGTRPLFASLTRMTFGLTQDPPAWGGTRSTSSSKTARSPRRRGGHRRRQGAGRHEGQLGQRRAQGNE